MEDVKKAEATRVLSEVLEHMGVKARLDVKDGADGSVSVAMTLDGELPGLAAGKRSHLLESLQFLINKIVNKQPQPRRWINLGVGEHPAPRQAKPPPAPKLPPQSPPPPKAASPQQAPSKPAPPQQARPPRPHANELELQVEEDSALSGAAKELAEKSARHGRFMAIVAMSPDDRARVLKAAKGVAGVQLKLEGEGRNRRLSLHPDKPAPMPKFLLPDYDEADDDEEQE